MNVLVSCLEGPALRWAVAKVLGLEVELDFETTYDIGWRVRIKGETQYFQPDYNWVQTGSLLQEHFDDILQEARGMYGREWDYAAVKNKNLQVQLMRALVSYLNSHWVIDVPDELGNEAWIPEA